jgi:hypothetical protein
MKKQDYDAFGIQLENVRNQNEIRVVKMMRELIPQFPDFDYCPICIQDVYALSLNQVSPKYVQIGTIVLKRELTDEDLRDIVENAVEQVLKNTNHS